MQKVDSIIKENPGVSLEDLVTSRKINADQRAQALKKPQLQSQLASLEEQLAVYRKIESDYQNQIAKEKDSQLSSHVQELDKIREETRAEAAQEADRDFKNKILTFSRFLAAAANRRNQGDDSSPEGRAFEGALLLVYGGDVNAVEAAEKIVSGSTDSVIGVDGISTNTSCMKMLLTKLVRANFDQFNGCGS
jgi:TolA-binding protein